MPAAVKPAEIEPVTAEPVRAKRARPQDFKAAMKRLEPKIAKCLRDAGHLVEPTPVRFNFTESRVLDSLQVVNKADARVCVETIVAAAKPTSDRRVQAFTFFE